MATTCESVNLNRKSPPQINPFRKFVTDELVKRKEDLLTTVVSPFVKLTSCLESPTQKYKFLSLGFHGFKNDQGLNIFDLSYGQEREYIGYAVSLDSSRLIPIESTKISKGDYNTLVSAGAISSNQGTALENAAAQQLQDFAIEKTPALGAHPVPGITNITLERFAMAAGTRAVVQWKCYNRQQLEFLRHHFLTVGTYVVLEWGHQSTSRQEELVTIDFTQPDIENEIAQCYLKGRKYITQKYVCQNNGNYDILAGTISNFTVNLDAETNVYTCTTTIVGPGEHLWSLTVYNTSIVPDADREDTGTDERTQTPKSNTFYEYFKYESDFDNLLRNAHNSPNIAIRTQPVNPPQPETEDDVQRIKQEEGDHQFISWNGVFKELLPNMIDSARLTNNSSFEFISRDINRILEFVNKQTEGNTQRLWVGNNPHLKSINPESMILLTSTMQNIPSDYDTIGRFDTSGDGKPDRGDLSFGVWLNAKMIRTAFLQAITLEQAIRSILLAMNAATAGYWSLQLQYDDEEGRFTIVDTNFSQMSPQDITPGDSKLYRFNVDTQGECISINFDSAFPPEVVTQLTIMAKIKAEPDKILPLIKQYPIIASSGHFAFAMNWTDLTDKVQEAIKSIQRGEIQENSTEESAPTESVASQPTTLPDQQPTTVSPVQIPNVGLNVHNTNQHLINVVNTTGDGVSSMGHQPVVGPAQVATAEATAELRTYQDRQPVSTGTYKFDSPAVVVGFHRKSKVWEQVLINESKTLPDLPWGKYDKLALVKAIITQESRFNQGTGTRDEGENRFSYGLMQIQEDTARRALEDAEIPIPSNFKTQLLTPEFNIKAGVAEIRRLLPLAKSCTVADSQIFGFRAAELIDKTLESVAAMYNSGTHDSRKGEITNLRGRRIDRPTEIRYLAGDYNWCLAKEGNRCTRYAILKYGKFRNQNYVQDVMYYYKQFERLHNDEELLSPEEFAQKYGAEESSVSLEGNTAQANQPSPRAADVARVDRITDYRTKFSDSLISLIAIDAAAMRRQILQHGLELNTQEGQANNFIANSFVAPIPTTCKIEVVIRGISGISIYDGFVVDKLPYIYERFGVFHVLQLKETINPKDGWRTTLMGTYRFLYFSANAMNLLQYEPPR